MYTPPAPTPPGMAAILGRLALGRDEPAWRELLTQVGPDLHRLARRLAGDAALAEDAVQESLLQIRDHADRFSPRSGDPDGDARRWLLRLTANTTLLLLRGHRRAAARHRRAAHEEPAMAATAPGAALEQEETATLVRRALAQLSEPARTAVVLHHCAGLGYEQVAAELRVPVGTAKTHVHRGLEKLRRHLMRAGCSLSLVVLAGALDGLTAGEAATAPLGAGHVALLHSPHHASFLALPTSGGLSMTAIATGVLAACLATAVTVGLVRGEDGAVPTASAPTVAAAPAETAIHAALAQQITVDFQDTDLMDTASFLQRISKLNIIIDPAILAAAPPPVTLKVERMELRHVLAYIAMLTGTEIIVERGTVLCRPAGAGGPGFREDEAAAKATSMIGTFAQPITFEMQDTSLDDCLTFLRQVSGVGIVVGVPKAQWPERTVTMKVNSMPLGDALHWIGVLSHIAFAVENGVVIARPAAPADSGFHPAPATPQAASSF